MKKKNRSPSAPIIFRFPKMETTAPTATARKPHAVGAPTTGRHRPAAAAAATTASRGGSDRKRRSSTARRRPLQVEAILHRELLRDDLSSTTAATIRSMIQDWVQSVARSEMVYRAGPVDLAKAPASITAACTRVSIVDLDEFLESAGERVEASTNEGTVAIWRVSDVQAHICFLYLGLFWFMLVVACWTRGLLDRWGRQGKNHRIIIGNHRNGEGKSLFCFAFRHFC